ncbi:Flp family type IVb pilin [Trichococcus shcherbakoviae subsp. psychrophilus]|uniref:Flp family type IVb pilin n=2 Tax=Trichococcus shcherbakoviae TaxID=2094020 RepID=A0A5C5EAM3_9LACT|nr:Flp family type IVb pilin [Trichococcus shcherbakoviae subsp. psychrophilus]
MMEIMRRLVQEEEGQGMVEYALIIALIALVAAVGLKTLGPVINSMFTTIQAKITNATT